MRKWIIRIGAGVVLVAIALAVAVWATALKSAHRIGFQTVTVSDPDSAPMEVGIWYPTDAMAWPKLTGLIVQFVAGDGRVAGARHPLIVISHGIAGALTSHADTALALADAGFVVAAPLHPGDNFRDQSAIGTTNWFPDRVRQVHRTISYMLEEWKDRGRIDADKIGVFGFSAGGTTALIAIGGMPDADALTAHCATAKEFACEVFHKTKAPPPEGRDFLFDPRIKAAVVIAPGIGFAFGDYGLSGVRVPVQLWAGEKDQSVPTASNAEPVRRALRDHAEWHLVPNAAHFSFMVPCGPAHLVAPKIICEDPAGFDRTAFHKTFNAQVVAYFQRTLAAAPTGLCIGGPTAVCFPQALHAGTGISSMAGTYDVFGRQLKSAIPDSNGYRIELAYQDYSTEYSRIRLDSICTAHWCQYYRKACDRRNTTCFYLLFQPVRKGSDEPIFTGNALWLIAHSDAMFAQLQNEVSLAPFGEAHERVPLKALTHTYPIAGRTPDEGITPCDLDRQTPGCTPLRGRAK